MDAKVEDSLKRIDVEASKMQRDLEKSFFRKLQGSSLREGAKCCDDMSATAEDVQECIRRSQQPLAKVQSIMKQELEDFQQRLQRCMLTCQDKVKDSMGSADKSVVEKTFGDCLCVCADDHLKLMPLMKQRLISSLSKVS